MIQLNLLPDVKQEYIKAERSRRLILAVSIIVTGASLGLLILLFSIDRLQQKHISDLSKDIKTKSQELKSKPDITKILTVQNQLNSLTALHDQKPAASRLFGYLNQVTPTQVDITNFIIDFTTQTITISGNADNLSSVNKYADTLKYTTYITDQSEAKTKAFSSVVMTSFGVNAGQAQSRTATYSLTLNYDTSIFDITKKALLSVPKLTTTRASIDQPQDLFQAAPPTSNKANEGN